MNKKTAMPIGVSKKLVSVSAQAGILTEKMNAGI
jgi:hypothetical protein